jgi:translation initiation factor 2B subunit (eIF-2B alpha/beta/delta family)
MQSFFNQTNPLTLQDIFENYEHKGVQIVGHIFDETHAGLITGIITEKGLISPFGVVTVMREMPVSDRVNRISLSI